MTKFWPYKLYCMLAFGAGLPGVEYLEDANRTAITLPELAAHLKLPASRLRSHLEDAQSLGLISNLKLTRGIATLQLQAPLNIDKTGK